MKRPHAAHPLPGIRCGGLQQYVQRVLPANADFLDRSIDEAIADIQKLDVPPGSRMAVAEITTHDRKDQVPSHLLRDALVCALETRGYRVVEGWPDTTVAHLPMEVMIGDRRLGAEAAADFALLYRVLEVGVRYGKRDSDSRSTITRRGRTAFNYRVVDCRTATVVHAGRADAFVDESIPKKMKDTLAKTLYAYHPHGHPGFTLQTRPLEPPAEFTLESTLATSRRDAGFTLRMHRFSEDNTRRLFEEAFALGYEKQFRVRDRIDIVGQVGLGASEERCDRQMFHVPLHLAALYNQQYRSVRFFAGGGLFCDYSHWVFSGNYRSAETQKIIEDPDGGAWVYGLHLQAGLQIGHWRLTWRVQRGGDERLGGEFESFAHRPKISWDGHSVSLGFLP